MRIKNYTNFLRENINLSIDTTDVEDLLKSINAEQVLMGDEFNFNSEKFSDIDSLAQNGNFVTKLDKKGYKRNNVEYSQDCETFLKKRTDIKFFLIFHKDDSELDPKPDFIVIQSKSKEGKWGAIKMYKVKENIRNFYDKLSSKTIELKKGDINYIYRTSNAGNDWTLQNIQNKNATFKDIMSNDEMKATLSDGSVEIKIVS
jgi:hypothetical protein